MKAPPLKARRYAVCVQAGEYEFDLVPRMIYEVWPDAEAEGSGWLRVVDESGADYLFPADYFRILSLPPGVDRLLRAADRNPSRRRGTRTRRDALTRAKSSGK
jgi:hypothetical protein